MCYRNVQRASFDVYVLVRCSLFEGQFVRRFSFDEILDVTITRIVYRSRRRRLELLHQFTRSCFPRFQHRYSYHASVVSEVFVLLIEHLREMISSKNWQRMNLRIAHMTQQKCTCSYLFRECWRLDETHKCLSAGEVLETLCGSSTGSKR